MEEKKKFNKQDYDNKYIKENKDRINFLMAKGTKTLIKAASDNLGITPSEFIREAISEKLDNVKDEIPPEIIPNLMEWLKNHGHTDTEIVDCLRYLGRKEENF